MYDITRMCSHIHILPSTSLNAVAYNLNVIETALNSDHISSCKLILLIKMIYLVKTSNQQLKYRIILDVNGLNTAYGSQLMVIGIGSLTASLSCVEFLFVAVVEIILWSKQQLRPSHNYIQ